ncbi:hypothetical protein K492DRAFT_128866 [Lichtheimia hyalospora FSU 10163]|nr:hypothetical protein K492DRAFT_128866 [Lichtheimia hyalospora FSU 10163]
MKLVSISLAILGLLSMIEARPTPNGVLSWDEAYTKAKKLVSQMSLEERVNITTGTGNEQGPCEGNTAAASNLFPALCLNDGPTGLRRAHNVSQFVAGINAAASWDRELTRQRGAEMGREFRAKGVNVILGPGMNMMRTPRAGRNWEFAGEDPYLTGEIAYETVIGLQSSGMITTSKHLIGNEQDTNRYNSSTNMDDKTLHELYLHPFVRALDAETTGIMCSYNMVNGTYACEDDYILNSVLKGELGFKGFVVSDWWATHSTAFAVNNGLDMTMPGDANSQSITGGGLWFGKNLTEAVKNGDVDQDRVTDMAERIVAAWYKVGQDKDFPELNFNYFDSDVGADLDVQGNSKDNIRKQGAASVVLLRNDDDILPLEQDKVKTIAVIGSDAGADPEGINQCQDGACSRGTLTQGWGSGSAYLPYLVTPVDGIKDRAGDTTKVVSYLDDWNVDEAAKVASDADIAMVFAKSDSGEMYIVVDDNPGDRNNISLWYNGDELIKAVADANKNTVVVIHSVGPILMPWIDHPNIKAIVWPGLPGQETGNSLADVLFGSVNPSGKLPYTIAKKFDDYLGDIVTELDIEYTEGVNVGYRHFDKHDIEPLYEFGYGLSYTTFDYTGLKVKVSGKGKDTKVTASFKVENTGHVDGAEVAQAYIGFPEGTEQPPKMLRGFEKVNIKHGKKQDVHFEFNERDLRVWDTTKQQWTIPSGTFSLYIGASSRDIRLEDTFDL